MDGTTLLALGSLLVAGAGAWNSFRKTRIDDRSGTMSDLRGLITTYKEEIDRLEEQVEATRKDCEAIQIQLEGAQRTIVQQANRISELERQVGQRGRNNG